MVKKPFEISAIIDPLNSMYADKEYDLFQLNNLTGPCFHLYKTYKKSMKQARSAMQNAPSMPFGMKYIAI